jgi:bifunctional non-homologous end joining protein LigD
VLVRYPDGIRGKNFYQWRVPRGAPPWVRSFPLESEDGDGLKTTFIVGDVDTLLFIANLGCIPIHVLAARTESLERPDFITVDFDLEDRPLRDAIVLARTLREILDTIGLTGYAKTSGQRGLHVHVAVGATIEYRTAKILGELLGRILVTRHPDLATMERVKERRQGKIYLDVFQIGRSRTIVAPYSVRAVPGATVATPLSWDEVAFALDPRAFTIRTVPERIARYGDPMKHLLDEKPDVRAAIEKLAPLVVGA